MTNRSAAEHVQALYRYASQLATEISEVAVEDVPQLVVDLEREMRTLGIPQE